MDVSLIFYCKFCDQKARTVTSHLHHIRFHRNISKFIYCGLGHCLRSFRTESCLRSHIIRNHKVFCHNRGTCSAAIPFDQNGKFVCGVQHCGTEFFDHRKLMSHLRANHLDSDIQIPCPFSDCSKTFTSSYSLTGHISKKHKNRQTHGSGQNVRTEPVDLHYFGQDLATELEESINEIAEPSSKEETLIGLAQFYQKLEYKHMVPASVNQYISSELRNLLTDMNRTFVNNIATILESEKLPQTQVSDIISSVVEANDLKDTCNALRSTYLRKKFYKDRFHFVQPEQVPQENGTFFYFIPIEESIQAAFKNKSWNFSSKATNPTGNGLLKDFTDGEAFKKNTFFQENPDAIPLIIYQDGLELSNPIGPAKNLEHKLEGIYMAFGNLPSEIRFEKDSIQLVAICKKNEFSRKEVYARITEDIIKLQESGTDIPNVGNVKAGLAFVAGDNLGSHGKAGLVENFSRSIFFCRYCLVQREQFFKKGGETRVFRERTVPLYNNAARKAKVEPTTGRIKSFEGVKFDSPFNLVHGFHVCTGLPPCLGHDLMEGVIAHDLKLFIQYFVRMKWFKPEDLNHMIKNFPYGLEDRKDRPPIIKKLEKSKLAGGAWQIYILLRLFPLIVYGHVKDANNPVWKLLLLLREITEIAVSPEIHVSHLPSFQCLIDEYLVLRRELFPSTPLRPKHHYMAHYSHMKFLFGPLIKVWTLRFESKHTFFKRSWKSSNNSINILQTLAFKHEYLQSWVRSGGGARSDVEAAECTPFNKSLYSEAIQKAVCSQPVSLDECVSVTVKGTLYKKGNVLILRQLTNFGDLFHVGIIHLIFVDSNGNVLFLVQQGEASLVYKYGAFKIKKLTDFECVKQNDLMLSYYPHCTYIRDTETYVCLRHAVVSQILDT